MEAFIQSVVAKLGISEDTAKSATGALLRLLQEQGDKSAVQSLLAKLPGAEPLIGAAAGGDSPLGGFSSALGGMLGGGGGALAALKSTGLDAGKAGSLVRMLIAYAREQAGPELVDQALAKFPALKAFV